jgi:hypothetical protein
MNPSFNLSNYTISFGKLVDKDCIFFEFQYDKILIEQLKNHLKVYWSCTQKLLGHAAIKTTRIYTQISYHQLEKIKSPLDHL